MDQKSADSAKRKGPQAVIADRVGKIREARGMSREKLAAVLQDMGIDWTRLTVNRLEIGRRESVTVVELLALCIALEVSPVDLLVPGHWTDQSYWVTPKHTASAENVREWIRGEALLFAFKEKDPDSDSPFADPPHVPWDMVRWMPRDRAARLTLEWARQEEASRQGEEEHYRQLEEQYRRHLEEENKESGR